MNHVLNGSYLYFLINIIGLFLVLLVILFFRRQRLWMFLSGISLIPASVLSFLHEGLYWRPLRLNHGVWGIEDVVFCFSVGSLAWLLGILPYRSKAVIDFHWRTFFLRLILFSLVWAGGTLMVTPWLGIMPATICAQCAALVLLLRVRPVLLKAAVWAGVGYSLYYMFILFVFSFLQPGFFSLWNGTHLWGYRIGGLPIEEFLWVLTAAACWSVFMMFAVNIRIYEEPRRCLS